jgi:formylglycine-generating enzyme required for sulfatase activity
MNDNEIDAVSGDDRSRGLDRLVHPQSRRIEGALRHGEHFVMKGASPVTARELMRPTFRNWFRARYPYVYASFRCAR